MQREHTRHLPCQYSVTVPSCMYMSARPEIMASVLVSDNGDCKAVFAVRSRQPFYVEQWYALSYICSSAWHNPILSNEDTECPVGIGFFLRMHWYAPSKIWISSISAESCPVQSLQPFYVEQRYSLSYICSSALHDPIFNYVEEVTAAGCCIAHGP